jgi:hypothetical protein
VTTALSYQTPASHPWVSSSSSFIPPNLATMRSSSKGWSAMRWPSPFRFSKGAQSATSENADVIVNAVLKAGIRNSDASVDTANQSLRQTLCHKLQQFSECPQNSSWGRCCNRPNVPCTCSRWVRPVKSKCAPRASPRCRLRTCRLLLPRPYAAHRSD